jgi:phosphate transport system ATP-binding protein
MPTKHSPERRLAMRPYPSVAGGAPILETRGLTVTTGARTILRRVDLAIPPRSVHGLIGPSGAGKSTLLRCLNRLVDLSPAMRVEGEVRFHGRSIRGDELSADELRGRIGILFQQPVVFPGSIQDNVVFGVRRLRSLRRRELADVAEAALREAALWDEVADRLRHSAATLSVGQKQRLCLARALAAEPEVLLMDEPTSALDRRSTEAIEELVLRLRERTTIVLVTHDLAQARRVADGLACLGVRDGAGELVESSPGIELLDDPRTDVAADFVRRSVI